MSHAFILELMEASVKFLGTVPASSIKKTNPEDDEDDEAQYKDPEGKEGDVIDLTKQEPEDGELDSGQAGNQSGDFNPDAESDSDPEGEPNDEFDPELDPDLADAQDPEADPMADPEMEPEQEPEVEQDPDRMGDIRVVKGAHLVYKRQENDGTFKELWIYNIGDHINDAIATKRAILAGTDIPEGKLRSEDGKQMYTLTTMGNAQMLGIEGLMN